MLCIESRVQFGECIVDRGVDFVQFRGTALRCFGLVAFILFLERTKFGMIFVDRFEFAFDGLQHLILFVRDDQKWDAVVSRFGVSGC